MLPLLILLLTFNYEGHNCYNQDNKNILSETVKRFISYDVNDSEGFNSRIDVFIRVANLLKLLPREQKWILVLPPWRHLMHWKSRIDQENTVSWKTFFDVKSLAFYLDVIEMEEFLNMRRSKFDKVFVLQNDMPVKINGESVVEAPCLIDPGYYRDINGVYRGMLGHEEFFAENYQCLSIYGRGIKLLDFIQSNISVTRFVFMICNFW